MNERFKNAEGAERYGYDVARALESAMTGTKLDGFTAEVSKELAYRHGGEGMRIPLEAVMKATGASPIVGGAVPLTAWDSDASVTELDGAIRRELLAGKINVSTRATSEAAYRIPYVNTRPTAQIVDVDEPLIDQGGSTFNYVEIEPVEAGSMIEIANSLDWTNPDAVAVVSRQIVDVVREAVDDAMLNGYGPTTSGRAFAGLLASATATGSTVSNVSSVADYQAIQQAYKDYALDSEAMGARWVMHPRHIDGTLPVTPSFTGSQSAMMAAGTTNPVLLGNTVTRAMLPVTAGGPDTVPVLYGDFSEIFMVLFNSATISLVSNPYADSVFAKGSTLLRVILSFGMGVRDAKRMYSATANLV